MIFELLYYILDGMTIQQIYDLALDMAINADPRGADFVKKQLAKAKKEAEKLSPKQKKFFDAETLKNPYSDSRIYVGDPKTEVKKIMSGIDISSAEILLADRLNEKGERIPVSVKVGDTVLFKKYGPDEVELDGKKYLIAEEADILAIVEA